MFPVALHEFGIRYRAPNIQVFNSLEGKSVQLFGQSGLGSSCAGQFTSSVHRSFTNVCSCLPTGLQRICVAKSKAELGLQSFSKTYMSIYLTLYVTNRLSIFVQFCSILARSTRPRSLRESVL